MIPPSLNRPAKPTEGLELLNALTKLVLVLLNLDKKAEAIAEFVHAVLKTGLKAVEQDASHTTLDSSTPIQAAVLASEAWSPESVDLWDVLRPLRIRSIELTLDDFMELLGLTTIETGNIRVDAPCADALINLEDWLPATVPSALNQSTLAIHFGSNSTIAVAASFPVARLRGSNTGKREVEIRRQVPFDPLALDLTFEREPDVTFKLSYGDVSADLADVGIRISSPNTPLGFCVEIRQQDRPPVKHIIFPRGAVKC